MNIRGERSVTCWGEFDKHPSLGPLPPNAPPVCEFFRHQPDALERAAQLDKQFGRNPDLEKMPMYGVVFSFKDPYDTKDMRSTGGGDAAYDIDFPARDHVLVEQLRNKGAIIFASSANVPLSARAAAFSSFSIRSGAICRNSCSMPVISSDSPRISRSVRTRSIGFAARDTG